MKLHLLILFITLFILTGCTSQSIVENVEQKSYGELIYESETGELRELWYDVVNTSCELLPSNSTEKTRCSIEKKLTYCESISIIPRDLHLSDVDSPYIKVVVGKRCFLNDEFLFNLSSVDLNENKELLYSKLINEISGEPDDSERIFIMKIIPETSGTSKYSIDVTINNYSLSNNFFLTE